MARKTELAELLRVWRDRLPPAAVGLPAGRRRTNGLRREEVALLAGVSVDYLVRLEQGRAENPSDQVIVSLARVLQLSELERAQLHLAAGLPAPSPKRIPTHIPGSVQRLLARLPDVAIGVYTSHWTLLTANTSWVALLGPRPPSMNLIEQQFAGTAPAVQQPSEVTDDFERALVSDLRMALIRYPEDPSARSLQHSLTASSERFRRLWGEGTLVEHRSRPKTFLNPLVGTVSLDCDVFTAVGTDLRIVTYTAAPNTEDASKFDLIRTIGVGAVVE